MTTVLCTCCGINEVPAPKSIEIDPICADCIRDRNEAQAGTTIFATGVKGCPGWGTGEDCGNEKMEGGDLCPDCHLARLNHESPYRG